MKPYYEDELVTLYHGDCLEMREWLSADVLITDPPYGIAYKSGTMPGGRQSATEQVEVASDATAEVRDAALEAWGKRPAIVFGSWRVPRPEGTAHRLIWHKVKTEAGARRLPWFSADEEIYVLGTGWLGAPQQSVYRTAEQRAGQYGEAAKLGHPTPKPVGLMEALIEKAPAGVIADPFAGSGATLIAARNLGRHVIGVELEERYCELIAKRAGQQAFGLEGLSA